MQNQANYQVCLIRTTCAVEEEHTTPVYGIEVRQGTVVRRIEDISSDKALVAELAQRLQRNPIPPEVLPEVAEDFVTELALI